MSTSSSVTTTCLTRLSDSNAMTAFLPSPGRAIQQPFEPPKTIKIASHAGLIAALNGLERTLNWVMIVSS
jgi:hypothetical protein